MFHLLSCGQNAAHNEVVGVDLICPGPAFEHVLRPNTAISWVISDAAQKYGADSTQPIWSELGTTSCTGSPEKFRSSHLRQLRWQNPSCISHFAIRTAVVLSILANACMILFSACPNWSIAPRGANFVVALLTDSTQFNYAAIREP